MTATPIELVTQKVNKAIILQVIHRLETIVSKMERGEFFVDDIPTDLLARARKHFATPAASQQDGEEWYPIECEHGYSACPMCDELAAPSLEYTRGFEAGLHDLKAMTAEEDAYHAPSQHSELADRMEALAKEHKHHVSSARGFPVDFDLGRKLIAALRQPPSDAMRNAVIEECAAKVEELWMDGEPYAEASDHIRALTQEKPDVI